MGGAFLFLMTVPAVEGAGGRCSFPGAGGGEREGEGRKGRPWGGGGGAAICAMGMKPARSPWLAKIFGFLRALPDLLRGRLLDLLRPAWPTRVFLSTRAGAGLRGGREGAFERLPGAAPEPAVLRRISTRMVLFTLGLPNLKKGRGAVREGAVGDIVTSVCGDVLGAVVACIKQESEKAAKKAKQRSENL